MSKVKVYTIDAFGYLGIREENVVNGCQQVKFAR